MITESTLATLEHQITLLSQYPLLLKRPIIIYNDMLVIGYDKEAIIALLQAYQNQTF